MDKEFRDLLKEIIDDPTIRKAREKAYKEKLAETKTIQQANKVKLAEIKELKGSLSLYVKDGKKRKELIGIIDKQIDSAEKLNDSQEKLLETAKKIGESFVGLGKAAYRGSGSISDFTDNIYGLKTVGRAFDTNIETFRQLSQVGGNFGKSIVDLRLAARDAALPLDDFAKLVANNSGNLALLFGSTTQGAKDIARLGAETRRLGIDQLAPLGFTVDEINETLLMNLDFQRRTGVLNQLSEKQRVQSAINFALELDKLAKLTGVQRQELQNEIEAQKANERFQVALQRVSEDTRQRLQGFAAAVGKAEPALATGIQDLIATGGRPITEASIQLIQNVPQLRGVIQDLISGSSTSGEALRAFAELVPASVDRFSEATKTGMVPFLSLQGPLLGFSDAILDVESVNREQAKSATSLVQGLTTFEQATKVLSSQFQSIETGLLQAFGPALGGFMGIVQGTFGVGGAVATMLAKSPATTATILASVLAGKYLFGKAAQIAIIAAGTAIGTGRGLGGMLRGLGMSSKGVSKAVGTAGSLAKTGASRAIPGLGAAIGVGSSASMLASDDEDTRRKGKYGLVGAGIGAAIGGGLGLLTGGALSPLGAMWGASLGSMAGQYFGGERQFGGGMDAGQQYLVGENGPEIVSTKSNSVVSANKDLESTFNTRALETKMASMVTELNAANKTLTSMVNGVNTLVAVESRALKAVETSARKDMNQVGMV